MRSPTAPASVVAALARAAEVPLSMVQSLVGFLVALPVVQSIKEVTWGRGLGVSAGDSKR